MSQLEKRLQYKKIFDKNASLSKSEAEVMKWLSELCSDLSPENVSCDGELSRAQVNQKLKDLKAEWLELEALLGRKVSEEEVYKWECSQ